MACILVLSVLFAFSSCKKDKPNNGQNSTIASTTEKENTDNNEKENSTVSTTNSNEGVVFFGRWVCDEIATPQEFYSKFYNPEITKTNVEMRTTYEFKKDGTFKTGISIKNISEVRKEYRSLMVEAGRVNIESKGDYLTPEDVLYYENYADKILEEICTSQKGTYEVTNNRIFYTINGETYYETFTVNGNELTLTGSSNSDKGYPVTLTKL